jgi:hypothetical protein
MNTLPIQQRLDLRREIAAWSDRAQKSAAAFAEEYRDLLPRRITNAQLAGLNNIVQATTMLDQVKKFIDHQREKASRTGYEDVPIYWQELNKVFTALRPDAEKLLNAIGISAPSDPKSKEYKALLDEVCLLLAREWVQHLVAHSLLLGISKK